MQLLKANILLLLFCSIVHGQNIYTSGSIFLMDSIDATAVTLSQTKSPNREGGTLLLTVTNRLIEKVLASADLSHGYYKGLVFGVPVLTLHKEPDSSIIIMVRTIFGGDGEQTADYLILYRFENGKLYYLYYNQLSYLKFNYSKGWLKIIVGTRMYTLSDGYDTNDTTNCFCFPLRLQIRQKRAYEQCTLPFKQQQQLLDRFERRKREEFSQVIDVGSKKIIDSIEVQLHSYFKAN